MHNVLNPKSLAGKSPLFEIFSSEALSFADFVMRLRVTAGPRSDLIALYKTLISARAFPTIAAWPDLYRFMTGRRASDETINEARKLWRQFQKSQTAVSPASNRRISHG